MGAGASVPDQLGEDEARALCGDKFDQALFDSLKDAESGTISKEQLLAQAPLGGGGEGGDSASGANPESDGANPESDDAPPAELTAEKHEKNQTTATGIIGFMQKMPKTKPKQPPKPYRRSSTLKHASECAAEGIVSLRTTLSQHHSATTDHSVPRPRHLPLAVARPTLFQQQAGPRRERHARPRRDHNRLQDRHVAAHVQLPPRAYGDAL
jgi:hypothetical protein